MAVSRVLAMVLVAVFGAGCTTTSGMGLGRSRTGTTSALFTWKQDGARSGRMTASLDTGEIYVGPFVEIPPKARASPLEPLWAQGNPAWPDAAVFSRERGAVIADLDGPDGRLRCRVQLTRPSAGLASGGGGYCQLPDGRIFGATFLALKWPG